jgi:hypothetical protein
MKRGDEGKGLETVSGILRDLSESGTGKSRSVSKNQHQQFSAKLSAWGIVHLYLVLLEEMGLEHGKHLVPEYQEKKTVPA